MLDSLVKLAEKFTELLKYRRERERNRFATLVHPIYADMMSIHQNYLNMFGATIDALQSGSEYSKVIEVVAKARREHEAMRRSLLAMAQELRSAEETLEYHAFFRSIVHYFESGPFEGYTSPSIAVLKMLDGPRLITYPAGKVFDQAWSAPRWLAALIRTLQEGWENIATEYTKLKIVSAG